LLILAAAVVALILRLPLLQLRPMHGDEAVHAYKLGDLLEGHSYTYDPNEYHGPTLNYLTLIPARLGCAKNPRMFLSGVNELTLRIVPVFFGVLLIVLLLLIADALGTTAVFFAAILIAVSPAMVFYSRYYIQEMLLVCFTFGAIACGYRYTSSKNVIWILLTGLFLGLMHATKETCIIAYGSMALALFLIRFLFRRQDGSVAALERPIKLTHLVTGLVVAFFVSALFHSSFLTNPRGIVDSFLTYTTYFNRASSSAIHIHPWYYYLKMLIYSKYGDGPIWTETVIIVLAVIGFVCAMIPKSFILDKRNWIPASAGMTKPGDRRFLIFIAFYTLIMTAVYSAVPYKTPWCLLGFLHGMILLAGVGAAALIKLAPDLFTRVLVSLFLFAGIVNLAFQAYMANYKFYADYRNPYVYAHPTTDVFAITERVEAIARFHEDGHKMNIQVICPQHDYWPLPWYLRSFSKVHWRDNVADDVISASLIIASPKFEQELLAKLYQLPPPGEKNLYVPLFDTYVELRPQIELRGYITKDLWDRFKQNVSIQPFVERPSWPCIVFTGWKPVPRSELKNDGCATRTSCLQR